MKSIWLPLAASLSTMVCTTALSAPNSGHGGSSGGSHSSASSGSSRASAGRFSGGYGIRGPNGTRFSPAMRPGGAYPIYGRYQVTGTGSGRISQPHTSAASGAVSAAQVRAARKTGQAAKPTILTTQDGKQHLGKWARNNPANRELLDPQTQQRLRDSNLPRSNWVEARQRSRESRHQHGRDWWRRHCPVIVFLDWGWWGWWDGWWYPAWGYDPYWQSYPYDGPIYGYDGLPPDEIVANVQSELQRLGYFPYAVDGKMGPLTQSAINRYQRDRHLPITGTVDPATVESLGLD